MSRFLTTPNAKGFVLLEALVAMSLIAGFESYQGLVLRYGKTQEQRRQIRLEADEHEKHILKKGGVGELARMSRGNGALPPSRRPTSKGER